MADEASTSSKNPNEDLPLNRNPDEASTSKENFDGLNEIDSSKVPRKFIRLKKSHRKRYKWLLSHGYTTEESLELCKNAVLYESKLSTDGEQAILPVSAKNSKESGKGQKRKKNCIAHLLVNAIKVGIIPADYPGKLITAEQQKMLEDSLVKQIILCTDKPGPSFYKISYRPSYIVLYCENDATAKWVKDQQNKLQILGIDIVVRDQDEFPPIRLVMGNFKCHNLNLNEIRLLIANQNKNIFVQTWKILPEGCIVTDKFSKVVFSIDEASFQYLVSKEYLISFLLGQVKLRHIKEKKIRNKLEFVSWRDLYDDFPPPIDRISDDDDFPPPIDRISDADTIDSLAL